VESLGFRVGTWNIDSLTGRAGELVEALAERRMDVACVQETLCTGSGCRYHTNRRRRRRRSEIMGSGYDASMPISSILLAKLSNTITN